MEREREKKRRRGKLRGNKMRRKTPSSWSQVRVMTSWWEGRRVSDVKVVMTSRGDVKNVLACTRVLRPLRVTCRRGDNVERKRRVSAGSWTLTLLLNVKVVYVSLTSSRWRSFDRLHLSVVMAVQSNAQSVALDQSLGKFFLENVCLKGISVCAVLVRVNKTNAKKYMKKKASFWHKRGWRCHCVEEGWHGLIDDVMVGWIDDVMAVATSRDDKGVSVWRAFYWRCCLPFEGTNI